MAFLSVLLVFAGMMAGCIQTPEESEPGQTIPMGPCHLSAPSSRARLSAKCGSLTVYEDHSSQSGRQIKLHIAMIPAISRSPEPDPILFITGGPGGASTQDFVAESAAFDRINQKRDIIMVDQRGTGQSHPLNCEDPDSGLDLNDENVLKAEIEKCIQQIDADLRFYNTEVQFKDLEMDHGLDKRLEVLER